MIPLVGRVRARHPDLLISVDTWRAEVARAAADEGADLVNDTWAGHDPDAHGGRRRAGPRDRLLAHGRRAPAHRPVPRRVPGGRGDDPLDGVLDDVVRTVSAAAQRAVSLGIDPASVLVDPTHDFGKNTWHSLHLVRRTEALVALGFPVLMALSRKDFVGETLDLPAEERLEGTLAATAVAAWLGARVFRAHDVRATRRTLDMVATIRGDRPPRTDGQGAGVSEVQEVDEPTAEPVARRRCGRGRVSRPWWVQVLAVYAAARLFTTVVFLWVASVQDAERVDRPAPGLLPVRRVHVRRLLVPERRRERLPGRAAAWAPTAWSSRTRGRSSRCSRCSRAGSWRSRGGPWEVVAPLLAARPGRRRGARHPPDGRPRARPRAVAARPGLPLATVALVSVFPTAAVLQTAYTEALALLLVASALLLLLRRRLRGGWRSSSSRSGSRAPSRCRWPRSSSCTRRSAGGASRRGTDTFTWRTGAGPRGARACWPPRPGCCGRRSAAGSPGVPDGVPADAGGVAWGPARSTPFGGWSYVPQFWFGRGRSLVVVAGLRARDRGARRAGRLAAGQRAAHVGGRLRRLHRRRRRAGQQPGAVPAPRVPARRGHRRGRHAARRRRGAGGSARVVVLMLGLQVLWVRQMWHANPVADWPP